MVKIINLLWFLLLFSLIFYPLILYGGVLPTEIFFIKLTSSILLLITIIQNSLQKNTSNLIKPTFIICLFIILIIAVFQLLPLPNNVISIVSPSTIAFKKLSQNPSLVNLVNLSTTKNILFMLYNPKSSTNCISIYPYASYYKLLFFIALTMLFYSIYNKHLSKIQIRLILFMIIISGLIQSSIYLISYLQAKPLSFYFYGYKPTIIAGTFINRDHFAAYLNMILPIYGSWIAFHFYNANKPAFLSVSKPISTISYKKSLFILYIFCFILMSSSLLFSLSRAAIVSCFLSFAFLVFIKAKMAGRLHLLTYIITITLIISAFVYWIGYLPILQRFKAVPSDLISISGRISVWKNSIPILLNFPLLGIGLHNSAYVFTKYKNFTDIHYTYLHNDYLQFAIELGIIAFITLIFIIILFYYQILKYPWVNNSRSQFLAFGMLASITTIALHSFFDFPLQTPSNAIIFTILIALLYSLMNAISLEKIQDIKYKKIFSLKN